MTDVRDAHAKGLLQRAPSAASIFRSMEHPDLTPLLRSLIEQSALPLRAVEVDFAPDSSGFSSSVYHRWFDHKWGRELREAHWVKAHVMCGVKTNIVTAADATITQTADSPYFVSFVETTARNFNINEVAADKAYLSKKNLRAVEAAGGTAYIPFKTNSVGSNPKQKRDTCVGTGLSLLQLSPRRVFGPLPQAIKRREHFLNDKSQVWRGCSFQGSCGSGQRSADKDSVPQYLCFDSVYVRTRDHASVRSGCFRGG